ncbi:MAG: porin [Candidatus Brocadiales bacterium]
MRLLAMAVIGLVTFISYRPGIILGQDIDVMRQELQALKDRLDAQDEEIKYLRLKVAEGELAKVTEPELEDKVEKVVQNYMETPEAKKKMADASPAKLKTGYGKKGFYLESLDGKFHLAMSGRIQVLYTFNDRETDINTTASATSPGDRDTSSFRLRRGRLVWDGHAFTKDLKFHMNLETPGTSQGTHLLDYYVDYSGLPEIGKYLAIKGGQFKVPFSRQRLNSSSSLQLVDRSIVNDEFNLDRDVGVDFHRDLFGGKLEYHLGIFTGHGINRQNENADNNMLYVGRIAWNPFGSFEYKEPDLDYSKTLKAAVGFAAAHNAGGEIRTGSVRTAVNDDLYMNIFTVDGGLKYKGFSLLSEAFLRNLREPAGVSTRSNRTNGIGYMVQGGYFIIPKRLEVASRYAWLDREFNRDKNDVAILVGEGTTSRTLGSDEEITFGLNYYFNGHKNKLQADISRLDQGFLRTSSASRVNDDKETWRFRLQYQLAF